MSLLPATLVASDNGFATVRLGDGTEVATRVSKDGLPAQGLQLGVRPESVRVAGSGDGAIAAKVELVERLGERTLIYGKLGDGQAITGEDVGTSQVKMGDTVALRIDGGAAHLFGPDGAGHHAEA